MPPTVVPPPLAEQWPPTSDRVAVTTVDGQLALLDVQPLLGNANQRRYNVCKGQQTVSASNWLKESGKSGRNPSHAMYVYKRGHGWTVLEDALIQFIKAQQPGTAAVQPPNQAATAHDAAPRQALGQDQQPNAQASSSASQHTHTAQPAQAQLPGSPPAQEQPPSTLPDMAAIGLSLAPAGTDAQAKLFHAACTGNSSMDSFARVYELGHGASSSVIAARRLADGLPVALKCLAAPGRDMQGMWARLGARELQMLLLARGADLSVRQHFIELLDAFEVEPAPAPGGWPSACCFVLERGECDLAKWADVNRTGSPPLLPLPLLKEALRGMLRPLQFMHSQGIIHRDVKPSNYVVAFDGCVRLCDFGISATAQEIAAGATSMQNGTLLYQVPEVKRKFGEGFAPAQLTAFDIKVRQAVAQHPHIVDVFAVGLSAVAIYTGTARPLFGWGSTEVQAPLSNCIPDEGLRSFLEVALSVQPSVTAAALLQHAFLQ